MTDLVTIGMGSAVTAYLLKDGVSKLLGPTCDYLGKETATWVEKRHHNIRRIFEVAIRRLGSKIDEEGTISPRILRDVINDGSWMDDSLSTEYFGGMLASARSSEGGEDIAFNFIQTLKNLSALQIRFHYVLYRAGQFALENRTEHVNDDDLLRNIIFIPFSDLMSSLNLPKSVDLTHFFG